MHKKSIKECSDKSVLYHIKKINLLLNSLMNDEFRKYGMTESQARTLVFLGFKKKKNIEVKQKDIEDYFGISHATVNGLISRLNDKGYVDYKQSIVDKRVKLITINEAGEKTMLEVNKVRLAAIESFNSIMSVEELKLLNSLFERMITELEDTKLKRGRINDKNI